jgi:hypothetical protein
LLGALLALPTLLGGKVVVRVIAALRTDRAVGPAQGRYGVYADLLVTEVLDSLLESLWLGFHNARILPKTTWLVKYIIALIRDHKAALQSGQAWAKETEPPLADSYFWKFFPMIANYNPADYWKHVNVPVLIVEAGNDERVPVEPSVAAILAV